MKWFAFVRDDESDESNDEEKAKVRIVSLGTDGTTVIDSIKPGQGKLPIARCAEPAAGVSDMGMAAMGASDFCSDALRVVPATGPGSALADGENALKGVPGGKIRVEYYAPDAGATPTCTATVDVLKIEIVAQLQDQEVNGVRSGLDVSSLTVLLNGNEIPAGRLTLEPTTATVDGQEIVTDLEVRFLPWCQELNMGSQNTVTVDIDDNVLNHMTQLAETFSVP
jgi:hypothetical protein